MTFSYLVVNFSFFATLSYEQILESDAIALVSRRWRDPVYIAHCSAWRLSMRVSDWNAIFSLPLVHGSWLPLCRPTLVVFAINQTWS